MSKNGGQSSLALFKSACVLLLPLLVAGGEGGLKENYCETSVPISSAGALSSETGTRHEIELDFRGIFRD